MGQGLATSTFMGDLLRTNTSGPQVYGAIGVLPAGQFPALTGAITTSAGSLATTFGASPTFVGTASADTIIATNFTGNGAGLTNIPVAGFTGGAVFYSGTTNIGNLSVSQVVLIGHTMPNTNYVPAVIWTATTGAPSAVPAILARTTTSFTVGVSAGITGGDNFLWSVIYSP